MLERIKKFKEEYKVYPVAKEIYSDVTTPINLLKKLKEKSQRFYLLESVEKEESIGRYSFLGYDPVMRVRYKNKVVKVNKEGKEEITEEDPMEVLRKYLREYKSPKIENLPSFTGGFVGYFAYEMFKYAEPKLKLKENQVDDFDLLLFDKVIAFDHLKKKIFIIANMKLDKIEENYKKALDEIEEINKMILSENKVVKIEAPKNIEFMCNTSREEFYQMVEKGRSYIKEGDIFQCVLSRRFEADYKGSLINAYRVLRVENPSPYMYFFQNDDLEICGTSPETLVKIKDNKIVTFPVAGTRKRGETKEEDEFLEKDLLSDEKELAEHNMLVDLARNDVGRVSDFGSVKVEQYLKIHRYSKVMHIASVVSGQVKKEYDPCDGIKALLPAGTLSGAPKFRACEIIDELEKEARGIYGGAIGYIDFTGNLDVCIGIRTAIKKGDKVYVQAGAGIVYDSIPKNEYEECENKAKAVINAVKTAYELNES